MQDASNSFGYTATSQDFESDHAETGGRTEDLSPATTAELDVGMAPLRTMKMAELLGSGRHGLVVRALLTRAGKSVDVAVKIPSGSNTLFHEAEALKRFAHPHVIEVVEGPLENGSLVLELCDEGTLAQRMIRRPLSGEEPNSVVRDIVAALRPIHRSGWIHGDISPGNIGLRSNGGAALLDFATAHLADGSPVDEGTAEFAGPFRQADPQLDVRSLAATMLASTDDALLAESAHFQTVVDRCDAGETVALDELVLEDGQNAPPVHPAPEASDDLDENSSMRRAAAPPMRPTTRAYGPGPGDDAEPAVISEDSPTPVSPWLVFAGVIAVMLLGASQLGLIRGQTETDAYPTSANLGFSPPSISAEDTLDAEKATWDSATGIVEVATSTSQIRFIAGHPGDVAAIADWNCDGSATLGVYRPATHNWFVFESWAADATSSVSILDGVPDRAEPRLFVGHTSLGCATPVIR